MKTYVGKHKYKDNPYDNYKGSGKILGKAYKKYGIENFKKFIILAGIPNDELACRAEKAFIKAHKILGMAEYNIAEGGNGGKLTPESPFKGKHHSEEAKRKLSEAHKDKPAWNSGKKAPSISKGLVGHECSNETREKMSKKAKIRNTGCRWYTDDTTNKFCKIAPDGFHLGRTFEPWNKRKI